MKNKGRLWAILGLVVTLLGPSPALALTEYDVTYVFETLVIPEVPVYFVESMDAGLPTAGTIFDPLTGPLIVMAGVESLPDQAQLLVLLHEIAHVAQLLDGTLWIKDNLELEWDADRWAVAWGCQLFATPPEHLWDFWKPIWDSGYRGDVDHGDVSARINNYLEYANRVCPDRQWNGGL